MTVQVSDLSFEFLTQRTGTRSGCVPYFLKDRQLHFIFGQDKESGDYTDFAGGVKGSDETVVRAALREFAEESLGAFGIVYETEVNDYICCYDDWNFLLFLPFTKDHALEAVNQFNSRKDQVENCEMSSLWIVKETELVQILQADQNDLFYEKTTNLLQMVDFGNLMSPPGDSSSSRSTETSPSPQDSPPKRKTSLTQNRQKISSGFRRRNISFESKKR